MRKSGVLLPIFSLPSNYGIGDFGDYSYKFVDFLKKSGQSYWQVLPLCPTSYGDSPYQSPSSFGGNPYFISPEKLCNENLITKDECDSIDFGNLSNSSDKIDYEKIYHGRNRLLNHAYKNFIPDTEYYEFVDNNAFWLEYHSLFMAVKESNKGLPLWEWEEKIIKREENALNELKEELKERIDFYNFVQYKFFKQWMDLKKYANSKGISIIGDIPIYVSMDSCDLWANPKLFQLDKNFMPTHVAGCPPDGFSKKGQLWGNPLYNWEEHRKQGYLWWIKRIEHSFKMYDVVRIDHFRGFESYYSIPYGSSDATVGKWEKGYGEELFRAINATLGNKDIIAEDLGFITDDVKKLLKNTGFAGIKVLEFGFDMRDDSGAEYLPHNYPKNCVAYTGTHDNQTLVSWLYTISPYEQDNVRKYLCNYTTPLEKLYKPLICTLMMSSAKICIVPIQDYLGLDDRARINTPATSGNNWRWRIDEKLFLDFTKNLSDEIYNITKMYDRL